MSDDWALRAQELEAALKRAEATIDLLTNGVLVPCPGCPQGRGFTLQPWGQTTKVAPKAGAEGPPPLDKSFTRCPEVPVVGIGHDRDLRCLLAAGHAGPHSNELWSWH